MTAGPGPRLYRVSALASGFLRLWRGWRVVLPVVVVNAVVQALLVWPPFTYDATWWVVLSALLSALAFGVSFGLVASTALQVPDGSVGWAAAIARLRAHLGPFILWAIVWLVAVTIGLALYSVPGIAIAALLPFLLLAVLDGRSHPLSVNFRTLGRRFWRWLVTIVVIGVVLVVADLGAGLFTFFTRNPLAALVVWLIGGFAGVWATTTWALIYRSAWSGPEEPSGPQRPDIPAPDLESAQ